MNTTDFKHQNMKKMGCNFLLITIISVIASSCTFFKTKNEILNQIKQIDFEKFEDCGNYIPIDDMIHLDSITIIPLKDFNINPIAAISRLYKIDSTFIIFDKELKTISIYGENGNYIRRIYKQGRGPGEYLDIFDGRYNFFNNRIEILDKAYTYRSYDLYGMLIEERKKLFGKGIVTQFHPLKNDQYAVYKGCYDDPREGNTRAKKLFIQDKNRMILSAMLPYDKGIDIPEISNDYFYTYKDTLRFYDNTLPFVYTFTKGGIIHRYFFKFQNNNDFENNENLFHLNRAYFEKIKNGNIPSINSVLETDNYILIDIRTGNVIEIYLYDKGESKLLRCSLGFYIKKLGIELNSERFIIDNNSICFLVGADQVAKFITRLKKDSVFGKKNSMFHSLMDKSVSKFDNYVLIILKFKS